MSWKEPNAGATNISGFGALPAGRRYEAGEFAGIGYYAQFFSSTEYNSRDAYNLTLGYDYASTFIYNYRKTYAVSVRCVKND
ncbi:MAG: FISUMP domain-containing protein [Bacteroidales bacterium]